VVFVGKSKDVSTDYIQYTIKEGTDQEEEDRFIKDCIRDESPWIEIQTDMDLMFIRTDKIKFAHRKVIEIKEKKEEIEKKKAGRPKKK
jgi:hypothetical protein